MLEPLDALHACLACEGLGKFFWQAVCRSVVSVAGSAAGA